MITFKDVKKNKIIELPTSTLVSSYRTMISGATISLKSEFVDWIEVESIVGLREPQRNSKLGAVITKPSDKSFFLGSVWTDHKDNDQPDEDLTLFEEVSTDNFEFTRKKIKEIKDLFPDWDGYHHGNKDYLK